MYLDVRRQIQLKKMFGDEQVYVIPRHIFPLQVEGFVPYKMKAVKNHFLTTILNQGQFMFHYDVEDQSALFQIVFFFIIKGDNQYLANCNELGFKKHIATTTHLTPGHDIKKTISSLILEEISYLPQSSANLIGFVRNNNGQNMGHLGFVFEIELTKDEILELEKRGRVFVNFKTLQDKYILFDNWAKAYINEMS